MKYIFGNQILDEVKKRYQQMLHINESWKIAIIRFAPSEQTDHTKYLAAEISAREKTKSFKEIGFQVDNHLLPHNMPRSQFTDLLLKLNDDAQTIAVIVQFPVSPHLKSELSILSEKINIDVLGNEHDTFQVCATSEAVFRLLTPFLNKNHNIAIVGCHGFVGRDVGKLLKREKIDFIGLDIGDDLMRVHDAKIVVSATGNPELLDRRHLKNHHQLVVDVGFSPVFHQKDKKYYMVGDVKKNSYEQVHRITPVPGGVGPLEIAVLIERLRMLISNENFTKWRYIEH